LAQARRSLHGVSRVGHRGAGRDRHVGGETGGARGRSSLGHDCR
jgi:hypothetical protein